MVKWTIFAVVSLAWIGAGWFFGSMVGGTAAGVPAARAQDECARRVIARAAARGETIDMMDARFTPECMAIHRATLHDLSAPAVRRGLLIGVVPVLLIGGLMYLRGRG
jgi:hypothetical protein